MNGIPSSAEGRNVVIFLDELPQATPSMQNLAANIIDGKVGDYTIDMNRSFIICAGNRKQDHAATYDIPRNVGNRLIRFDVRTSFAEWEEWAVSQNLNPMVIGYLKDKQHFFNEPPPEDGYIYGTPRSWHKISCQMESMEDSWYNDDSLALFTAQGTVGVASAVAFFQFAKAANKNYSINAIFEGKNVKVPPEDQKDILFALVLEATYRINSWVEEALSDAEYQSIPVSKIKERIDKFTSILAKEGRVDKINRVYTWIDQPGIDKSFSVLINKYQTEKTRQILRTAMMMHTSFQPSAQSFERITKSLISTV